MKTTRIFKLSIFLFLLGMEIQCQPSKKPEPINAEFKITNCEITYKGQPLPIGKPIEEWVKMFGKYDRDTDRGYVWDSLGFVVNDWNVDYKYVDDFYLFFMNLDSELGENGKLEFAQGYYPITPELEKIYLSYDPEFPDVKPHTKEEVEELKEEAHPRHYIYPYHPYRGTVDFQGAPIRAGMSLKEVNEERSKIPGIDRMGYWNKYMSSEYHRGSTQAKTGEMLEFREGRWECGENQEYWYDVSLRYSEGELEYLRVMYENKKDLF